MSIRPIRLFGDPVLRTPAEPVTSFDAELQRLVKDLTDTMMDAPGVGLAAPQIGVGLRVFTYYVNDVVGYLINPTLELSAEIVAGLWQVRHPAVIDLLTTLSEHHPDAAVARAARKAAFKARSAGAGLASADP